MHDLGIRLKQLREQKGLTQKQLAQKIHKSKTVISKYENNVLIPTLETMTELSLIFNVSLDYLNGISSKSAVSLNGLTEDQTDILLKLSNMFREKKPLVFQGLTNKQLELLNDIIREFSKTEK